MPSKTSYFNRTLFKKNLSRFMPLWAGYFVVCFVTFSLFLLSIINSNYYDYTFILESARIGGVILPMIICVITAICMWGYLYNPRSANFYASLPIKREGLFLVNYLSGLTGITLVHTAIFLINLLLAAFSGNAEITHLLQWFLIITLNTVFFYSFASFCAMLTGNGTVLAAVYGILNFAAVVLELIFRYVLVGCFVYGFANGFLRTDYLRLGFLSPVVKMISDVQVQYVYNSYYVIESAAITGWATLLAYAAVGLVFAAAALVLFKRRKMESASDVIAIRALRPVFKYCLASGCAVVLGSLMYAIFFAGNIQGFGGIYRSSAAMTVFLLIGAFIGYYAAEMMLQKSVKVIKSGARGFLVMASAIIVICLALVFDVTGVGRKLPEPGRVEKVYLTYNYGDTATLTEQENIDAVIDLHKLIYDSRNDKNAEGFISPLEITYKLKGGGELRRYYYVHFDSNVGDDKTGLDGRYAVFYKTMEIMNCLEAINYRVRGDIPVNSRSLQNCYMYNQEKHKEIELTTEEALDLYNNCILPDAAEGLIGKVSNFDRWNFNGVSYAETMYPVYIHFNLINPRQDSESEFDSPADRIYYGTTLSIRVSSESRRTVEWLKNYGFDVEWTESFDFDAYRAQNATPSDLTGPSPAFTDYPSPQLPSAQLEQQ